MGNRRSKDHIDGPSGGNLLMKEERNLAGRDKLSLPTKIFDRESPGGCYLTKGLIVGEAQTGKSSLLLRFSDDTFTSIYLTTIGVDFKLKRITIDGRKFKLQIWDTAGSERFRTITTSYYRGAHFILLVFIPDSSWEVFIDSSLREIRYYSQNALIIFVASKLDLRPDLAGPDIWVFSREILCARENPNPKKNQENDFDEGTIWASLPKELVLKILMALGGIGEKPTRDEILKKGEKEGCPVHFTCAKTGEGVNELFHFAAKMLGEGLEAEESELSGRL